MSRLGKSPRAVAVALSATALVCASVALGACGGDSDEETPATTGASAGAGSTPGDSPASPAPALTKYLPTDSIVIRTADVKAAAKQLGLPADTDPFVLTNSETDLNDDSVKLSLVAAAGFGPYEQEFGFGRTNPVVEAFDGSAMSAGASNFLDSDQPVSAIKTSQPFARIAASLEKVGFKRDGKVVRAIKPKKTEYSSVADAGHGVIVVAANQADAGDLVASPPGGPKRLEALIAPSDQPVSVAVAERSGCVREIGGWSDTDGKGVMRFTVQGGAGVDAIDLDALEQTPIAPGTPEADGDTVEVPFSKREGSDPSSSASPLQDLILKLSVDKLYACPGD